MAYGLLGPLGSALHWDGVLEACLPSSATLEVHSASSSSHANVWNVPYFRHSTVSPSLEVACNAEAYLSSFYLNSISIMTFFVLLLPATILATLVEDAFAFLSTWLLLLLACSFQSAVFLPSSHLSLFWATYTPISLCVAYRISYKFVQSESVFLYWSPFPEASFQSVHFPLHSQAVPWTISKIANKPLSLYLSSLLFHLS